MKRFAIFSLILSLCALLSACNFFTQPVDLQTENLENEQAGTQIAAVRASATVNADRMVSTLANAQTAVGEVDQQSTQIVATLMAQGTLVVNANVITPVIPTSAPQQNDNSIPQIANPLLTPGAPQVNNQGSAQGDSSLVQGTPTASSQQNSSGNNTSGSSGGTLSHITLAEQVDKNDCAVHPTTNFSSDATDIYVVATANTPASASFSADFTNNGQEIKTYSWTPGFSVQNKCIWFHLTASDATFTPGNWAVQLTLDGKAVGAPIPFTITSNTPSQINVTPEVGG